MVVLQSFTRKHRETEIWKRNQWRESAKWPAIPSSRMKLTHKFMLHDLLYLTNWQTREIFGADTRSTFNATVATDFQNIVESRQHNIEYPILPR